MTTTDRGDVRQYMDTRESLRAAQAQLRHLEDSDAVDAFTSQVDVLRRQLADNPRQFRDLFINAGLNATMGEFQRGTLTAEFTRALWDALLRDDDGSTVVMCFLWDLPLRLKRTFIRALDEHMSERYPMFDGLSKGWPAGNNIPPYVREPEVRAKDFDLVNQGYLGYRNVGYSQREVDLFVWLEALRDKQCADSPCELGVLLEGKTEPEFGCPVQIHIPTMLELLGQGKFREALELLEGCNPLPNVTGRVCPQELQCQGACVHRERPIEIGQLEWFLPQREKAVEPDSIEHRYGGRPDPWQNAARPPIAIVGSGPSGLINAFLLAAEGFPVTVFEAFHDLGGVLRYGIPEFRLPNELIDDVVAKIRLLGGKFVTNFVVGKTASIQDLKDAGFWRIFVGSGAGLPMFMNVPGEHLLNVVSANEFLTRVNLMQANREDHDTPLQHVRRRRVMVIGGGNTAMDAARTAQRLGGRVTIAYRRTQAEMPARVEELHHALEEGIEVAELRSPREFVGDDRTQFVKAAVLEIMTLGEPDASGRRRPIPTGETQTVPTDLVIMALGNSSNPIIKDSQPDLETTKWGNIAVQKGSQETSLKGVYTGGDAARGGSTAIRAAGDGQAAAREIIGTASLDADETRARVRSADKYTKLAGAPAKILRKVELADGIFEFTVQAPVIARAAQPGQFVRVLGWPTGELIPLTLADWDAEAGTITLVIQAVGASTLKMNAMQEGDEMAGIAGPLGLPSELHSYAKNETVVFTAGGVGLPPAYPIVREHLRLGNHVTLISGFRSESFQFWTGPGERLDQLKAEFADQLDVVLTSDDGSFGIRGFVTTPLEAMLEANQRGEGRRVAEVVTVGPPQMMRAVSTLTERYAVPTVASLNSIMVDATGMCGACMVPVQIDGKLVRKHACIDGPEFDSHAVDWEKFLPRFNQFKDQEQAQQAVAAEELA